MTITLVLVILLIFLQFADIITTSIGLKNPNNTEANPIMAKLFAKFGVIPTLTVIKAILVILLLIYYPGMGLLTLVILNILYILVVGNNAWILYKANK